MAHRAQWSESGPELLHCEVGASIDQVRQLRAAGAKWIGEDYYEPAHWYSK